MDEFDEILTLEDRCSIIRVSVQIHSFARSLHPVFENRVFKKENWRESKQVHHSLSSV